MSGEVFNTALNEFINGAQAKIDAYYNAQFPRQGSVLKIEGGRKYIKISKTSTFDGVENEMGKSVYCFINKENGDVLKAASWKAPAKHARGNIYNEDNGLNAVSAYGANYL